MTPALAPTKEDYATVQAITRQARSSFYWSLRIMPNPQRSAMFAVYALCRVLDDIADGPLPAADKVTQLEAWRDELHAAFKGNPAQPITRVLAAVNRHYHFPLPEFDALIEGMLMDANGPLVGPDLAEMELYCRRVAGTVGRLSLAVFGRCDAAALAFGDHLADALQLTNILRDQAEDAAVDRLYFPREVLQRHHIPVTPQDALTHPDILKVRGFLGARARAAFRQAEAALEGQPRQGLGPALMMMATYTEILNRLEKRGWGDVSPLHFPRHEKLLIALGQLFRWPR
ncbi:MAG: squalene/phytoene synthase family protein [Magnetospiraceae bacterium]